MNVRAVPKMVADFIHRIVSVRWVIDDAGLEIRRKMVARS